MKWLANLFKSPYSGRNRWFYVQCHRCKEIIKGRVDLYNDLSIRFGEGNQKSTYYCRKVVIGSNRCYLPIEVEMTFDANRKLLEREITGGEFVTEEEYLADLQED